MDDVATPLKTMFSVLGNVQQINKHKVRNIGVKLAFCNKRKN